MCTQGESNKITRYQCLLSQHGVLRTFGHRQSFCFGVGLRLLLTVFLFYYFKCTTGTCLLAKKPPVPRSAPFGLKGTRLYTTMLRPEAGKRVGEGRQDINIATK